MLDTSNFSIFYNVFPEAFYSGVSKVKSMWYSVLDTEELSPWFLAPLAEGQQAIVMALFPSCVRPLSRPSVRACVRP